jgi:hypothetical protein
MGQFDGKLICNKLAFLIFGRSSVGVYMCLNAYVVSHRTVIAVSGELF